MLDDHIGRRKVVQDRMWTIKSGPEGEEARQTRWRELKELDEEHKEHDRWLEFYWGEEQEKAVKEESTGQN